MIKHLVKCAITTVLLVIFFHYAYLLTPMLDNMLDYMINNHTLSTTLSGGNQIDSWADVIGLNVLLLFVGLIVAVLPVMLDDAYLSIKGDMPKITSNKALANIRWIEKTRQLTAILGGLTLPILCNPWFFEVTATRVISIFVYTFLVACCLLCAYRKYLNELLQNTVNNDPSTRAKALQGNKQFFATHQLWIKGDTCYLTSNGAGIENHNQTRIATLDNERFTLLKKTIETVGDISIIFAASKRDLSPWHTTSSEATIEKMTAHLVNAKELGDATAIAFVIYTKGHIGEPNALLTQGTFSVKNKNTHSEP